MPGTLHPFSKVHLLANKVGEAFVNFIDLESAELAIDASKNRTLTYGNSILIANAGYFFFSLVLVCVSERKVVAEYF
jgi:hypothetical protein